MSADRVYLPLGRRLGAFRTIMFRQRVRPGGASSRESGPAGPRHRQKEQPMEFMTTAEIREKYLSYFEGKGCKRMP